MSLTLNHPELREPDTRPLAIDVRGLTKHYGGQVAVVLGEAPDVDRKRPRIRLSELRMVECETHQSPPARCSGPPSCLVCPPSTHPITRSWRQLEGARRAEGPDREDHCPTRVERFMERPGHRVVM